MAKDKKSKKTELRGENMWFDISIVILLILIIVYLSKINTVLGSMLDYSKKLHYIEQSVKQTDNEIASIQSDVRDIKMYICGNT